MVDKERSQEEGLAYDVALSFAGEDRAQAEELARTLREAGVRVFYDVFEQSKLWGKDLFQHLHRIYGQTAKYCIVFVSEKYLEKSWTKHELQQAQARSFTIDREYILPVRLDDTSLPGLNHTIGYLDLRTTTIPQVASMMLQKLGMPSDNIDDELEHASWKGDFVPYNGVEIASIWPKRIERAQHQQHYLITAPFERIRWGDEKRFGRRIKPKHACGDCAALPGQLHVPSCDMEECPACGGQALSCGCIHEAMTFNDLKNWEERDD